MLHSASTAPSRALKYRPSRSPSHQCAVRSMLTLTAALRQRRARRLKDEAPTHLKRVRRLQLVKARADVVDERPCNHVQVLVRDDAD